MITTSHIAQSIVFMMCVQAYVDDSCIMVWHRSMCYALISAALYYYYVSSRLLINFCRGLPAVDSNLESSTVHMLWSVEISALSCDIMHIVRDLCT